MVLSESNWLWRVMYGCLRLKTFFLIVTDTGIQSTHVLGCGTERDE